MEYVKGAWGWHCLWEGRFFPLQAKSLLINTSLVRISCTSDHTLVNISLVSQVNTLLQKLFHMCKHFRVAF